ncbi:MAG: hypothetical protein ACRD4O_09795 [Bryobacteraceae bacterium]
MPRFCAIVLLGAMTFWLNAPAIASGGGEQIPACCRAHGKHKCMMRRMVAMDATGSAQFIGPKCPFMPSFSFTVVNGPSAPKATQSGSDLTVSRPVAQAQAEALFRISFTRSRQKRGPPVILLS